jgi:uncharacterized membrane protein
VTYGRDGDVERASGRRTAMVRVALSGLAGMIVGVSTLAVAPWQVSSLLAWDTAAAIFCARVWIEVRRADAATTQRIATREDDSRPAADAVLIAAGVASLLGVGFALLQAPHETGRCFLRGCPALSSRRAMAREIVTGKGLPARA